MGMTDPLITQLVEARKVAGLSQRELAEAMSCVPSHVSMLEGGRTSPRLDTLRRWAQALGLQPGPLVPLAYETAPSASSVAAGNGATEGGHTFPPGLVILYGETAQLAREAGVPVFVDGDSGEIVYSKSAVARTLDVAERTVEKAREGRR